MSRESKEVEFEIDGEMFTADVSYTEVVDSNYGADADGNRGVRMTFIEDIEIERVVDSQGNERKLTGEMEMLIEANL